MEYIYGVYLWRFSEEYFSPDGVKGECCRKCFVFPVNLCYNADNYVILENGV